MTGIEWSRYRTVVEEADASVSIDNLKNIHDRFSDQWDGFVWLVARHPKEISLKKTVNGVDYRLSHRKGDNQYGLLDIAVIYIYNDEEITIIDVNAW